MIEICFRCFCWHVGAGLLMKQQDFNRLLLLLLLPLLAHLISDQHAAIVTRATDREIEIRLLALVIIGLGY